LYFLFEPRALETAYRSGIPCQLGLHRHPQINATIRSHFEKQNRHIRHLGFDLRTSGDNPLEGLLRILPNEMLQQFASLGCDGHGHFLGIVKLRPVPRVAESTDFRSEFLDAVAHGARVYHSK
jgi:hypothetical protein